MPLVLCTNLELSGAKGVFITSSGEWVRNGAWIANLLEAILLPHQIAVVKCDAHTGRSDDVSRGNARADVAAKSAAHTEALLIS